MLSALLALVLLLSPVDEHPVDGVDVASWEHPDGQAIDWGAVARAGVDFATVKATEGSADTAYTNPWFGPDLDGARAAGLPVAPYHFYLGRTPGTGAAQAEHFIAAARAAGYTGQRPLDLPPILDLEWDWKGGKCPPYASVADAKALLEPVQAAFGRRPWIYTNRYFVSDCLGNTTGLGDYPLQVAHYAATAPTTLPAGWDSWLVWQFTARDTVPGIPAKVTHSVLNGDLAALGRLSGAG